MRVICHRSRYWSLDRRTGRVKASSLAFLSNCARKAACQSGSARPTRRPAFVIELEVHLPVRDHREHHPRVVNLLPAEHAAGRDRSPGMQEFENEFGEVAHLIAETVCLITTRQLLLMFVTK
jgi:hypothetical protein